jgi:CheY-like chemotaxis protein
VVILDMNMPAMGGAETLPRLRALRPALPILVATGCPDQASLDLVAAHPDVALLAKPFDQATLRQALEGLTS